MSRPRVAPSAVRTPSSRRRAAARDRNKPAMFTHITTSTTAAPIITMMSTDPAPPTIALCSGTGRKVPAFLISG